MSGPDHLVYDEDLRKRLALVKTTSRFESIIDKPGGKGPTGRRRHKDDDGSLVARITTRTRERFVSRSHKVAEGSWTVRLLTNDGERELGRVEGLEMNKSLHRQALELLIQRDYKRRAHSTASERENRLAGGLFLVIGRRGRNL